MTRPTISVQAAIGPGAAVTNVFIIGTSLIGGTDVIGDTPIFGQGSMQEIGDRCSFMSTRSGRQRQLEQFRAATFAGEFDNTDGALDPSWTAGPYTDSGVTRINPNVAVKAVATWAGVDYPLYYGFADAWKPVRSYPEGGTMGLTATDAFKILTRIEKLAQSPVGAGDTTKARLNRILDLIGWSNGARDFDAGSFTHQATTLAGPIANQLRLEADSGRGNLFVAPSGKVTFHDWFAWYTKGRSLVSQWTFGDGATEISPAGFAEMRADDLIYNDINISRVGGSTVTRQDPSVTPYPYLWSSYNRADLTLETDAQATQYAEQVLRTSKDGGSRVDYIELQPDGFDDLWPVVLGAKFGDRITCNLTHPYTGVRFLGDYFIEGIDHDIPPLESGQPWTTVFYLSSAAAYPKNPFIIGSSLIGGTDVLV